MLGQQIRERLEEEKEMIASLISDFEVCMEDCASKKYLNKYADLCLRFCSLERFINTMFYLG